VETGNAELGFVAMSQIAGSDASSRWIVPAKLYTIISQDAVLLKKGADNGAARAFLAFLKGPEARAIKEKYGYGAGD
jgi:molybdate transport system substrate-binding protein